MGVRDIPPELPFSSIYGFEVSDLVRLAMVLRDTGLTPEDLKEANRVFIRGAKYAIDRLNESIGNEIIKSITAPNDKETENLSKAQEVAKKWRYNNVEQTGMEKYRGGFRESS